MISRTITRADIASVTGFSRDKLKGLFRELPGFNEPAEQARVAREYSRHDLIVLAVCCYLDERFGLKRAVIGQLISGIQQALLGPRTVASQAHLVINVPALTVQYIEKVGPISEGLVFPLRDIFKRVDEHIEYGKSAPLELPPVAMPAATIKASRASKSSPIMHLGPKKVSGARR